MTNHELDQVTEKVIGCAFKVANTLGCGFLEKVYENALAFEIGQLGLKVEQQKGINVLYEGILVGHFDADLLIEEKVLVELKVVRAFDDIHMAQCLNYLKATGLSLCLLLNFAKPKIELKRIVRRF